MALNDPYCPACMGHGTDVHECEGKMSVVVPADDIQEVVNWWRGATEAPGGCSAWEAIMGMQDVIMRLEVAKRKQTGRVS